MTTASNKSIYLQVIERINQGDMDGLDQLIDPNIVNHDALPEQPAGLAGFKEMIVAIRDAFPDLHGTVEELVAEGDNIAGRVTWSGTQKGEYLGVPATGKHVTFSAMHLVRIEGIQIAEWRGVTDIAGLKQQLFAGPRAASSQPRQGAGRLGESTLPMD